MVPLLEDFASKVSVPKRPLLLLGQPKSLGVIKIKAFPFSSPSVLKRETGFLIWDFWDWENLPERSSPGMDFLSPVFFLFHFLKDTVCHSWLSAGEVAISYCLVFSRWAELAWGSLQLVIVYPRWLNDLHKNPFPSYWIVCLWHLITIAVFLLGFQKGYECLYVHNAFSMLRVYMYQS